MTDRPAAPASGPSSDGLDPPVVAHPGDAARRFRRRLRLVAAGFVVTWTVLVAIVTGVATGAFGDLGLPTDAEGRPRGLVAIGAATVVVTVAATVAYRRTRGPVSDLLRATEQVAAGDYATVDVAVRGPTELRLLAVTFNEMAAGLAAGEEQRRRFLADITHELRNPLAVLQSEIEAQMDGIHPRDDDHLASLLDETRRLGHLVDDLHTLALAESGRLVLRREPVEFGALVDDVVARHEARAVQRGIVLGVTIGADIPRTSVDPARVRQVLDNLLTNAIRHTPAGGEVVVTVTTVPGPGLGDRPMVQCQVTDAGPGFREDQLDHVFERFTRAGDSRGSGLGLSIVQDLVRAHGGTIEASNEPTTGGASVRISLPA